MRALIPLLLACIFATITFSKIIGLADDSNKAASALNGAVHSEADDIDRAVMPTPDTRPNISSNGHGFIIVHGANADSVSAQVNRRLNQGYFLEGALLTERNGASGFEYIQAMRKR